MPKNFSNIYFAFSPVDAFTTGSKSLLITGFLFSCTGLSSAINFLPPKFISKIIKSKNLKFLFASTNLQHIKMFYK